MEEQLSNCKAAKCEKIAAFNMSGYCFSHFHDTIKKAQEEGAALTQAQSTVRTEIKRELDDYERSVYGIRNWREYKFW